MTAAVAARRRKRLTVLGFMSPWLIGFAAFVAYPMGASLYYSFTRYDILSPPEWVGLANYRAMFDDPSLWLAIKNTAWLVVVGVPIEILFGLATALLLSRRRRGATFYRTVLFLPSMAPAVAATLAFTYLLDPGVGPVNRLLGGLGLPEPLWFYDPSYSKPGLVLLGLWGIGPTMILMLAGLGAVPPHLRDLARTEGATRWQVLRHVTLPALSPVILFIAVIGVIHRFQYFTEAYVASAAVSNGTSPLLGAPQGSTLFYSTHLYRQGFGSFLMGYASALAWLLLVATMLATFLLVRLSRPWVHAAGDR
jgi:multiple sugar transport system permease protein